MKSKSVSVNVTANGLAANQAQQTANQAQKMASANIDKLSAETEARLAREEANAQIIKELNDAQSDFESNLAWTKSQIYEGQHQNDSAVNSLKSDMEATWNSMTSTKDSLYNSASTATSEVDKRLESLKAQNSKSLSDLQSSADSLHARANSLYSNADSTRRSLMTATSELENSLDSVRGSMSVVDVDLRNEITSTKSDLASKASSLASATSEVQDDLTKTRTSLGQADTDLKNGLAKANTDITSARNDLASVRDSLAANDEDIQNDLAKATADIAGTKNDLASQAASLATASSELGSGMDQAYASLHAADDSLRTATSEIKQQTGKISGSLSTADSMIMFNSNTIAEVKRTANLIEADLTNTKGDVASVQVQANGLQSQITDNKNNISSVKQTADGLEQTVKHGSRNLIKTAMELNLDNGNEKVGDYVVGLVNAGNGVWHEDDTQAMLSVLPPELNGQKLTVSFDVLTNDASQLGNMYVNIGLFDGQGNRQTELDNVPFANITAKQWTRFSHTFDIPQDWTSAVIVDHNGKEIDDHTGTQFTATLGLFYYSVQFKNASSVPYKIKCAQAEFGPNATAFVAPDSSISKLIQTAQELTSSLADSNGNISQLQQTAKQISAQVADNAGNISQLQQTADGLGTQIANTNGDVSALRQTANTLQSSIADNKNDISSVRQTANQLSTTLSNQAGDLSNLKQTANSLQSQISNANGDISNVKQTANDLRSQVTDNKNNISSVKQTATNLTSQMQDANNDISQLQQTANGLSTTVKSGSRNLVKTAMELKLENTDEDSNGYVVGLVNAGNGGWHEDDTQAPLSVPVPGLNGQQVTVSFDLLTKDASQLSGMAVNLGLFNGQGTRLTEMDNIPFTGQGVKVNEWSRFATTFNVPSDWTSANLVDHTSTAITDHSGTVISAELGSLYYSVQFKNKSSIGYKVKRVQAEFGPNATAFAVPDSSISQLIQTSKELKSLIADNDGDISQLQQTAKSLQSQIADSNGNISALQQTAGEIKQSVKDNQNNISSVSQKADSINASLTNTRGDVTALQATAKGLTSWVSDAEGNISSLQQTANGLSNDVKDAKGNISSLQQTAKSYGTRIADAEGNVSTLKQTATGLQSSIADNKNNISSVKQKADSLQTQLSNANGDISSLKQTATGLQSQVTDNKNNISSVKQTATKLSSDMKDAKGNISSLQQTATGLSTTVKSGSRNLIKTAMELKLENKDESVGDYVVGLVNPGNGSWHEDDTFAPLSVSVPDLNGQKLTVGFDLLVNDTAQLGGMYANLGLFNGQGARITELTNTSFAGRGAVAKQWKRISMAFDVPEDWTSPKITTHSGVEIADHTGETISATLGALYYGVQFKNTSSIGYKIKRAQAEIGPNATAFVAPDFSISKLIQTSKELSSQIADSDGDISQLRQMANLLQMQVADNRGNISDVEQTAAGINSTVRNQANSVSQLQQKADSLQSQITDTSGNVSKLTQTANGLQSEVKDASRNISSLQQTAKQLDSDMKDAKGNISNLQQTATQLSSDMKDAKNNVSSLQQTATSYGTRLSNAEDDVSTLQQTATTLQTQITDNKNHASTIEQKADGISARVSGIENNKVVGSLLKLTDTEAGLGSYVNGKLIAGINTNKNGDVLIDGDNVHIHGSTHIDNGAINAEKITVHNQMDNGEDQNLAIAWGKLSSIIGGKDDNGNTLWGSINQTKDKFSSYYTKQESDSKNSTLQASLIKQTSDNIVMAVSDAQKFHVYTLSASSQWDFNHTKSIHENWFVKGDSTTNYFHNGPNGVTPWVYVTSRGSADGTRFVTTVWKDNDPTQYQRTWTGDHWTPWVIIPNTSNMVSAINMSPDGIKIDGKYLELNSNTTVNGDFTVRGRNIELNGDTKVTGRLDLIQDGSRSIAQGPNYHNPWNWNNAHIYFDNYLQLLAEDCNAWYTNTKTSLSDGNAPFYSITTLTPGYLKFTTYKNKVNIDSQFSRSYLDSGRLETPEIYTDKFVITGHHIRVRDNQFLMVTNKNGTNFDDNGSVGFQVYGGIVLGKQTIGSPTKDIYFQQGNIDGVLNQHYSDAPKVTLHAQNVVSQTANKVSSRLSVKTAITKVTYDRALMAVQNTDMYDYKYIGDDSNQHYVSGIIDDVHSTPEYNMDTMLINKERTARIDANLLGYHHVVIQKLLERLAELEKKVK